MTVGIPTIDTPRTVLRELRETDFPAMAAMHAKPEVMQFLGVGARRGQPRTARETWDWMQNSLGQWCMRGYGIWAIEERATGTLLGRAGLLHPYHWPEPELAYTLDSAVWGRGLAVETAAAIRNWGFAERGFPRLVSFIDPRNLASRRVASKLGAVLDGLIDLEGRMVERWVHDRPGSGPVV